MRWVGASEPKSLKLETREPSSDPFERVYRRKSSAGVGAALLIIGGCLALALALIGVVIAIFARVDEITRQLLTTVPAIVGIGALTAGWRAAKAPLEVGLGPGGLRITTRAGSRTHPWPEVGWATVQPVPLSSHRQIQVFDAGGKQMARLPDALEDFDGLAATLQAALAAKRDGTAERVQLGRACRSAIVMLFGGLFAIGLGAVNFASARADERAARLLATEARPGIARIKRRFIAPNGVTPRLVYEVRAPDGRTGERNAEVERDYWDSLADATSVPVSYVASDAGVSRLARGEVIKNDWTDQPRFRYILSVLIALVGLIGLAAGGLSWRGWDIDIDSKTGKLSIRRYSVTARDDDDPGQAGETPARRSRDLHERVGRDEH
jgi:hypothetical protein